MDGQLTTASVRNAPFVLVAVSVLFLVPIGFMVALLLRESRKDISFVDKEIAGLTYEQAVWPVIEEVLETNDGRLGASITQWDAIRQAGEINDSGMGTLDARNALGQALGGGDDSSQSRAAIMRAAATLITKINDGSNLTLDPDLESFYLMDSATVKLPELAVQTAVLASLDIKQPTSAADASVETRMNKERLAERFRASLTAFDRCVDSVSRATGVLHPAIALARNRIDAIASSLSSAPGDRPTSGGARPTIADLARAETQYWSIATLQLNHVLTSRSDRLVRERWTNLFAVFMLCVGIFSIVGYLAFSANSGIDRILRVFRRS